MIKIYATTNNGKGYVECIGSYEDISEIQLRVGMFKEDVVLSFAEEVNQEEL